MQRPPKAPRQETLQVYGSNSVSYFLPFDWSGFANPQQPGIFAAFSTVINAAPNFYCHETQFCTMPLGAAGKPCVIRLLLFARRFCGKTCAQEANSPSETKKRKRNALPLFLLL